MNGQELTLTGWQSAISQLTIERGWNNKTFLERHFLFMEEVGELTKAIREAEQFHTSLDTDRVRHNLKEEFADVTMYLFDLANVYGIDLGTAMVEKMAKNQGRQWTG